MGRRGGLGVLRKSLDLSMGLLYSAGIPSSGGHERNGFQSASVSQAPDDPFDR